jgi:putative transposase
MPQRRSIRLRGYDYARSGYYFITICTENRACTLGSIENNVLTLSTAGRDVSNIWLTLPRRFPGVALDAFVVMPNHVHGIVVIDAELPSLQTNPQATNLGAIVRSFKAASSRLIRTSGLPEFAWQANYYEHVIRTDLALDQTREYIEGNPAKWATDEFHP